MQRVKIYCRGHQQTRFFDHLSGDEKIKSMKYFPNIKTVNNILSALTLILLNQDTLPALALILGLALASHPQTLKFWFKVFKTLLFSNPIAHLVHF